jgi:hypothetical protein
MLFY